MTKSAPMLSPPTAAFETATRVLPIDAIVPLKTIKPETKSSSKYQQIGTSIAAIGLIELPVVIPAPKDRGKFFLLDGALRIACLKDQGKTQVECIVATDEEAYTYNKRINRLVSVQENRMIVKAIQRGASIERIAKTLGLDVSTIEKRTRLLHRICPEAISLLEDKPCPIAVFELMKKMQPLRQIEAAELMCGQNNFSISFARAIFAATSEDQLTEPKPTSSVTDITREQIARLERELGAVQQHTRNAEDTYGADNLTLTVTKTYLAKLLHNASIHRWLAKKRPEYLAEFQTVAEVNSLSASSAR